MLPNHGEGVTLPAAKVASRASIRLTPGAQRFIVARQTSDSAGTATPSTLRAAGTQFDVTYSTVPVTQQSFAGTRQSRLRAAYVEH